MNKDYDKEVLLHEEVFMPEWVLTKVSAVQRIRKGNYRLSKHFKVAHAEDVRDYKHAVDGDLLLKMVANLEQNPVKPFEVELRRNARTKRWEVTKYVIRVQLTETADVAIVVRFNRVITAWINLKTDNHASLNRSKYISNFC